MNLEVDAKHRDSHREPAEVVFAGPEHAAAVVSALDRSPMRGDPPGDLVGGGVERDSRLVAMRGRGDALLDVGGGIPGRQRSRLEPTTGRGGARKAVDTEGAPVLPAAIPGSQVPPATDVDERVRLDLATAVGAIATAIGEAKALAVAARG